MHTRIMLRITAVIAASAATLSLANAAAAQEESKAEATECGAGVIEVCGERTTYECEWEWGWTYVPYFPYRGYIPHYACDVDSRDTLYRHYARSTRPDAEY